MIWKLCEAYKALPFEGGVLEQPLGLLITGMVLGSYADAFALFEADPSNAPPKVKSLVLLTALAAANEEHGERG